MIRHFESLTHLIESAPGINSRYYRDHAWDLGVSAGEAKIRALKGDMAIADRASALIDRIEPEVGEIFDHVWEHSYAGSRVDVPGYLSGRPDHMRRRIQKETHGLTVTVYFDLTSSMGIDALDLVTRGCSVIAFLETLQRARIGVELIAMVGCSSHTEPDREIWGLIPIDSKPLDISSASFVLAHPAFPRNLVYKLLENENGFTGGLSKFANTYGNPAIEQKFRDYLGCKPQDVVVPFAHLRDPLIWQDPKKWVEERVKQCLENIRKAETWADRLLGEHPDLPPDSEPSFFGF